MSLPKVPNKWNAYMGIMTETTAYRNQRWFHIYVPELLPAVTGDVTPENAIHMCNVKNIKNNQSEIANVKVTKTIHADYFGIDTSKSVPTMTKGQQVLVINFGDTDKYYWIPLERDDALRTFETIRWSCADMAVTNKVPVAGDQIEVKKAGLTDLNTYFIEIDTRENKHILLSTANTDGEFWRYFFKIDAVDHTVEIWDEPTSGGPSNVIKLESCQHGNQAIGGRITLQNASGCSLVLDEKDVFLNVERHLIVKVKGNTITDIDGNVATHILQNVSTMIDGTEVRQVMLDHREIDLANRITEISLNETKSVGINRTITIGKVHTETEEIRIGNAKTSIAWTTRATVINSPFYTVNGSAYAINFESVVLSASSSINTAAQSAVFSSSQLTTVASPRFISTGYSVASGSGHWSW